ncbi:MAG TPA: hypothetical protein VJB91_01410 [Patescibacteria group bacterium]|nr:hypothetical protein [Patescibacteria group bacterium]
MSEKTEKQKTFQNEPIITFSEIRRWKEELRPFQHSHFIPTIPRNRYQVAACLDVLGRHFSSPRYEMANPTLRTIAYSKLTEPLYYTFAFPYKLTSKFNDLLKYHVSEPLALGLRLLGWDAKEGTSPTRFEKDRYTTWRSLMARLKSHASPDSMERRSITQAERELPASLTANETITDPAYLHSFFEGILRYIEDARVHEQGNTRNMLGANYHVISALYYLAEHHRKGVLPTEEKMPKITALLAKGAASYQVDVQAFDFNKASKNRF